MNLLSRIRNGRIRQLLCNVQPLPEYGADAGSGGGVSGGSSGSGGSGSSGAGGVQMQQVGSYEPVGRAIWQLPIVVPVAGAPVNAPAFPILKDYVVEVEPIPGNTQAAFYSNISRQASITGPRASVAANAIPRTIDVHNLAELWINASVNGEGLQITVRKRG